MSKSIKHTPTDKTQNLVLELACANQSVSQISAALGVSRSTVHEHYKSQLEEAKAIKNERAEQKLLDCALGQNEQKFSVPCLLFYLKTQCGYNENAGKVGKKERQAEEAKEEQAAGPFQPRPTPLKAVKG